LFAQSTLSTFPKSLNQPTKKP